MLRAAIVSIVFTLAAITIFMLVGFHWALPPDVVTAMSFVTSLDTYVIIAMLIDIGFVGAFTLLAVRYAKLPLDAIGFRRPTASIPKIITLVTVSFVAIIISRHIYYYNFLPEFVGPPLAKEAITKIVYIHGLSLSASVLYKAWLILIPPFFEECLFRGLFFQYFQTVVSTRWALILQAIAFAVVHEQPDSFFVVFFIGLALGIVYRKTKSIYVPIALHSMLNLISVV